jgi:hypothetical protein
MKRANIYIYPERTIETFDAGDYRVNLRRMRHVDADLPVQYRVDVWESWNLLGNNYLFGDLAEALAQFERSKQEVAVRIACEAFGLTSRQPRESEAT